MAVQIIRDFETSTHGRKLSVHGVFVRSLSTALIMMVLSSCRTVQTEKAEIDLPDRFKTASIPQKLGKPVPPQFWKGFEDQELDSLIAKADIGNISVQQAAERLKIAQAGVVVAGAEKWPLVQATSVANATGSSYSASRSKAASASLQFSMPIDIFKTKELAKDAAIASAQAAYANIDAAKSNLLSQLISEYVDLKYYSAAIAITRANIASYQNTLRLTKDMQTAGVASKLDVAQAEAQVASAGADLPPLKRSYQQSTNRIATLTGSPASIFTIAETQSRKQPVPTNSVQIGIPADLIRHRPDVRREERLLAASVASLGIAQAQLYPALSLSGTIDVSRLLVPGSSVSAVGWNFASSLIAPIFNAGKINANIDIAQATSRVQYLEWRATVLAAVEDVENALIAVKSNRDRIDSLQKKVTAYKRSSDLAREAYKGGAGLIFDVLNAERNLADARIELADANRQYARSFVALNVAVGINTDGNDWVSIKN